MTNRQGDNTDLALQVWQRLSEAERAAVARAYALALEARADVTEVLDFVVSRWCRTAAREAAHLAGCTDPDCHWDCRRRLPDRQVLDARHRWLVQAREMMHWVRARWAAGLPVTGALLEASPECRWEGLREGWQVISDLDDEGYGRMVECGDGDFALVPLDAAPPAPELGLPAPKRRPRTGRLHPDHGG
jgi:hypothetical protein